jgi:hypothetical protein
MQQTDVTNRRWIYDAGNEDLILSDTRFVVVPASAGGGWYTVQDGESVIFLESETSKLYFSMLLGLIYLELTRCCQTCGIEGAL